MKAYKCDCCGKFVEDLPHGVLYDNRAGRKAGDRYDLCPECVEAALGRLFGEPDSADTDNEE